MCEDFPDSIDCLPLPLGPGRGCEHLVPVQEWRVRLAERITCTLDPDILHQTVDKIMQAIYNHNDLLHVLARLYMILLAIQPTVTSNYDIFNVS